MLKLQIPPLTLKNRSQIWEIQQKQSIAKSGAGAIEIQNSPVDFVSAVNKYGTTEKGKPLLVRPWFAEYLELIGDFSIATILTTGAAQIGKTLAHVLLVCYCLVDLQLNTLWTYAQERTLNKLVPRQFRPLIGHWLRRHNIVLKRSAGVQSNTLFQVGIANASFTYVSTVGSNKAGGAAAGGSIIGESADIAFLEERSQYPPGADAPIYRRLDASSIPSHPVRQLGTPGAGGGIEAEIASADLYFYPAIVCRHCGKEIFLDPKGCLLKHFTRTLPNGQEKTSYLSESGKPVEWHCTDPNDPVENACFCCYECGNRIEDSDRIGAGFKCKYTGIWLRDFLEERKNGKYRSSN